jgi:5'(3')-deoxyribonucleotidase
MAKRILLDCDGVTCNFTAGVVALVNRLFGTSFTEDDVTDYQFAKSLGLTDEQAAEVYRAVQVPGFCTSLTPYPDAIAGVHALGNIAPVYMVTSPWKSPTWASERADWLFAHFGIPSTRVVSTSAKYVVDGSMIVDDHIPNLDAWKKAYPYRTAVKWDQLYNRDEAWERANPHTNRWEDLVRWARYL